jgi:hypothetical protein
LSRWKLSDAVRELLKKSHNLAENGEIRGIRKTG